MEQSKFQPGEVVRLTSGGPEMTIVEITANLVKCRWFSYNKRGKGLPYLMEFQFCELTCIEEKK